VKALQMIRTVEFSQMLYTIDDVTKYRGILISRYFLSLDTVYRRTFLNTAHPYALHCGLYLRVCSLCFDKELSTVLEIGTQRPFKNLKKKNPYT